MQFESIINDRDCSGCRDQKGERNVGAKPNKEEWLAAFL